MCFLVAFECISYKDRWIRGFCYLFWQAQHLGAWRKYFRSAPDRDLWRQVSVACLPPSLHMTPKPTWSRCLCCYCSYDVSSMGRLLNIQGITDKQNLTKILCSNADTYTFWNAFLFCCCTYIMRLWNTFPLCYYAHLFMTLWNTFLLCCYVHFNILWYYEILFSMYTYIMILWNTFLLCYT